MRRRTMLEFALASSLILGAGSSASAQDHIHKVGRGLVNVLTGWIEVPKQLHLGAQAENPVAGISQGLRKGVSLTVLRLGTGVFEAVTFPIPYPKDFAPPYEHMALSDYAWE